MLELLFGNMPLALLSVGLILMALEALSPGAHLIVVGVALAGAGFIGLIFPPVADVFVLSALTLVIGLAAAYVYNEFDFYGGKGTAQTSDSSSLAGSTGYVTEAVTSRDGEVKLDDGGFAPFYSARSTSGTIEEGEEIIVLDPGGGNVLTVESLGAIGDDEIDRALAQHDRDADSETDETGDSIETTDSEAEPETETEKSS
ncbi:Membrane protein implicated in regulation of membrane protease activity [Natronorubrum sediminis]|uniref:Membrane protein implicated in regulation of membrane protease activity n=1 Tax=Natronorubrum sediminis TaxID=640943 RepID=A0A1H6FQY3_9EURY|nr:NfeD family protein [Natronorubrum sediminis]SEH12548.1 Membrane protein implicated in regulation of membrane protease activity [Natronorubrum sediminis]